MIECMMVDADFCIKLGGSEKYPFLRFGLYRME